MKKYMILVIYLLMTFTLFSQSVDSVLQVVVLNNTGLAAQRDILEAEITGNKTGLYPDNPEVGYNYLWGSPALIGNRKDLSITQSFDFPTAYGYKSDIAEIKNRQAELEYVQQKNELLLNTSFLLYDIIHLNALHTELSRRQQHARDLAQAYSRRLDAGDANILEYNKAQISLLNISKELNAAAIELEAALSQLAGLNGGNYISFDQSEFGHVFIPLNFEVWFDTASHNNPALRLLRQETELNQKMVKLNRALSLPSFNAGYMSEKVAGEQFQGVIAGVTIPLWENKNSVKYAKALADASESMVRNAALQFYNQLKILHAKAVLLQHNVTDYRQQLAALEHSELLRKALDAGEITLIDYILELSVFYESVDKLLEMETELHKSAAELNLYGRPILDTGYIE